MYCYKRSVDNRIRNSKARMQKSLWKSRNPRRVTVAGNLAPSSSTFASAADSKFAATTERHSFCGRAFARDRDDRYRKGCFGREIAGDGLNAHSKFRLNGISIHTEHVPKGNLPNVAFGRWMREAVFGRYRVIGRSAGGEREREERGGPIMRNEIVTIIIREYIYIVVG